MAARTKRPQRRLWKQRQSFGDRMDLYGRLAPYWRSRRDPPPMRIRPDAIYVYLGAWVRWPGGKVEGNDGRHEVIRAAYFARPNFNLFSDDAPVGELHSSVIDLPGRTFAMVLNFEGKQYVIKIRVYAATAGVAGDLAAEKIDERVEWIETDNGHPNREEALRVAQKACPKVRLVHCYDDRAAPLHVEIEPCKMTSREFHEVGVAIWKWAGNSASSEYLGNFARERPSD